MIVLTYSFGKFAADSRLIDCVTTSPSLPGEHPAAASAPPPAMVSPRA